MARIIETTYCKRRIIKMSTEDVISVVREYLRIVPKCADIDTARNYLSDSVLYIPEDI